MASANLQQAGTAVPSVETRLSAELMVLCGFLFLTIVLRLPDCFRDVPHIDETVFLLMGQSMANGHLPYTEIWDIKPPGGYAIFAAVQILFPDSLLAVRLFGALVVGLSGFLTYRVSLAVMPRYPALLAGVFCCVASSLLASGVPAVMMEHLANPLLLAAVLLAIRTKPTARDALLFGIVLAAAILIRTNLAFVALIGGVALVLSRLPEGAGAALKTAGWGALGGILVLAASALPFLLAGKLGLYVTSVITVPLAYSQNGIGLIDTTMAMLGAIAPDSWQQALQVDPVAKLLFWCVGTVGLVLLAAGLRLGSGGRAGWAIIIATFAVVVATIANRQPYDHYLIQLMPFFAIGAGFALWKARLASIWAALGVFALSMAASIAILASDYADLVQRYRTGGTLYYGQNIALADYLRPRLAEGDTLFVSRHLLLYWLLDRPPVLPIAAFPSNMFREDQIVKPLLGADYTTERLLGDILDKRPSFIVLTGRDKAYIGVDSFVQRIESDYDQIAHNRDVFVFERKDH